MGVRWVGLCGRRCIIQATAQPKKLDPRSWMPQQSSSVLMSGSPLESFLHWIRMERRPTLAKGGGSDSGRLAGTHALASFSSGLPAGKCHPRSWRVPPLGHCVACQFSLTTPSRNTLVPLTIPGHPVIQSGWQSRLPI